jgi:predicted DNA-binding protein (UPF0251 family)
MSEPKGLPGFSMAVTKQGLRFYRESTPKEASFIDMGRVIRVYKHDDETLLAALQLAQEKWGGVKINGSDEYKRRCAWIAAEHGIRIANFELQGFMKEIRQLKVEPSLPVAALLENERLKPELSVEAARNIIEAEARAQETQHWKLYGAYREHKKALREHIGSEPEKPLILGVKKWKQEHEQWKIGRDYLGKLIVADLETLGVDTDGPDLAEQEAERKHKSYREHAHNEALRLHPDAAEVIRLDESRREREKDAAEEMERERNERYSRLRAKVRKLAEARAGERVSIVTNAQEGKKYSGVLAGVVEQDGRHVAVQALHGGHVIIHDISADDALSIEALAGHRVEISGEGDSFRIEVESRGHNEKNRGRSR